MCRPAALGCCIQCAGAWDNASENLEDFSVVLGLVLMTAPAWGNAVTQQQARADRALGREAVIHLRANAVEVLTPLCRARPRVGIITGNPKRVDCPACRGLATYRQRLKEDSA